MESLESLPNDLSYLNVIQTRSRSNSDAILQSPPNPEISTEEYTDERLQSGLLYVTTKLKRDLTPRTKDFLSMHKDAYQAALATMQSVENRERCRREVQTFDKIYRSNAFLYRTISTQEMEGLNTIRKIREYEILARYGDYLAQEVQDFRVDVYTKHDNQDEEEDMRSVQPIFSNEMLWTEIAETLKVEQEEIRKWKRLPGGEDSLEKDVRWALKKACKTLGIDTDHMYWAIQHYATRNRTFHSNINTHIARCHWGNLAKHIHTDLGDLPLVMGLKEAVPFERCLRNIQNRYFRLPRLENDPGGWAPNDHARELTNEMVKKELQRQEKLKRPMESEETPPEESRRAKRKEKRANAASMAEEKDEQLAHPKIKALSEQDASTQTDGIDSSSILFCT